MGKKKDVPFGFAIVGITTDQFSINTEGFDPKEKMDLTVLPKFNFSKTQQLVGVRFKVTFSQKDCQVIVLEVTCHFRLAPDTWSSIMDEEEGKLTIPLNRALHLGTVTLGTVRGVLHARLAGSPFAHFVLPAINLIEMVKADIVMVERASGI
ncbi:MAG: hypothetical protein K9J06_12045 [Flavobacteriales bacterium]|nr:hypothetical protein [Flavobacteriales bacterium]